MNFITIDFETATSERDSQGFDNWFLYQFTKYPSLSVKVYDSASDAYLTFDPNPEYDSKGRLTKFKMYNGDGDYFYKELAFTYYK
jgi:hypothetical protein